MKLREGNVFTPVCDSVRRGGSLSIGGRSLSRGFSVRMGLCPARGGSVQGGEVSVQGGLCQGDPQERAVRLLLECILVENVVKFENSYS